MSIVFTTPGELDIRAFTTFGLSAKPGSDNPIGKFGTGLKNAVAMLMRNDCGIKVFIGTTEYEFLTVDDNFRGQNFKQIRMRKRQSLLKRWQYVDMPFTTELGKFWEPWQAFRELESNTRDEGGLTYVDSSPGPESGRTTIIVSGLKFEQAYKDRDKTFLPNALTKREGDDRVQVFNEPSKHLYWRGIRVFDLDKPSVYTYNILEDMELTEDRTLKYVWQAQAKVAAYVARSRDPKMISSVVSANAEKFFEGRLDWDYAYVSPSAEFKEVLAKKKSRGAYISPRALGYYDRYAPAPVREPETLQGKLTKWAYNSDIPDELKDLLKLLLRCEIKEPAPADPNDDGIPF